MEKIADNEILFTADIAKMFKLCPNTIRRRSWREKTGIPLHKVGRCLCASRVEIEKWFKGLS